MKAKSTLIECNVYECDLREILGDVSNMMKDNFFPISHIRFYIFVNFFMGVGVKNKYENYIFCEEMENKEVIKL